MNRKDFLKKTCGLGICGGLFMISDELFAVGQKFREKQSQEKDAHQKFFENWLTKMMENLEENFEKDDRIKLMEECGRNCAKGGAVQALKKAADGNFDKMLITLKKWLGEDNVKKNGDKVEVIFSKCYCHLLEKGPEKLPETYCYCSQGWIKEMFESVVNKPVQVTIHETVKRGGDKCRFTVKV